MLQMEHRPGCTPLLFSFPSRMFFKDLKKALYHHFQFTPNVRPIYVYSTVSENPDKTGRSERERVFEPLQKVRERIVCFECVCVWKRERERVRKSACAFWDCDFMCVLICSIDCVRVCECVCERERLSRGGREREREWIREGGERESEWVAIIREGCAQNRPEIVFGSAKNLFQEKLFLIVTLQKIRSGGAFWDQLRFLFLRDCFRDLLRFYDGF